ncbi:Hypothetical protein NTJ_03961 [Nesidiocoris tenuis]|uniref:Uncharacterized protein n=1 Tax=Nesidiocoris tenuis TaxID=355587 RepID=A0ABN7AFU2_9HEMI|nr:Hypothetical protein NTJ_03961 [Nesidiocoris tenuis]
MKIPPVKGSARVNAQSVPRRPSQKTSVMYEAVHLVKRGKNSARILRRVAHNKLPNTAIPAHPTVPSAPTVPSDPVQLFQRP